MTSKKEAKFHRKNSPPLHNKNGLNPKQGILEKGTLFNKTTQTRQESISLLAGNPQVDLSLNNFEPL